MNLQAKTLILLHGLIGTLSDSRIIESFGNNTVYAPDLLGYGSHRNYAEAAWTLNDQVEHVAGYIEKHAGGPVHVVGHSVGGAVSVLLAAAYPTLVSSVTSVEGNMTLDDAFWSAGLASKPLAEVESMLKGFSSNIDVWLEDAGVTPSKWTRQVAKDWLVVQPASTVQNQARAVVEATSGPQYLQTVNEVIASQLPFHLLAGQRSLAGWHLPEKVRANATSFTSMPDCGHLMMLEDPAAFARCVLEPLD